MRAPLLGPDAAQNYCTETIDGWLAYLMEQERDQPLDKVKEARAAQLKADRPKHQVRLPSCFLLRTPTRSVMGGLSECV